MLFAVSDDGDGDVHATSGTGEGLANVRQRLDALYGSRASVTLERRDGHTETRVTLPLPHGARTR
jgi:LytS/YehU family sensor histidine kinase